MAQQGLFGAIRVGGQVAQQSEPDFGLGVCGRNDVENEIDDLLAHYGPFGPDVWSRAGIRNRTRPPAAAGLLALSKANFRLRLVLLPSAVPRVGEASGHYGPRSRWCRSLRSVLAADPTIGRVPAGGQPGWPQLRLAPLSPVFEPVPVPLMRGSKPEVR